MCKYHTVDSKGFAPGNSQVLNSLEPWRGMLRLDSSFPSWPNYATSVGVGGGGLTGTLKSDCDYLPVEKGDTFLAGGSEA